MAKRNNNLIVGQNLLAMALAKNAWDEGLKAPYGADMMDDIGFYGTGSVLEGLDMWGGYSFDKSCWPIMTQRDYDSEHVLASNGRKITQEGLDVKFRGDIVRDNGRRVVKFSSEREVNRYEPGEVKEAYTPSTMHFYFATWFESKKIRVINSPIFGGETYSEWNGEITIPLDMNKYSVVVYEITDIEHFRSIMTEMDVVRETEGVFETKPYTWYYITVTATGLACSSFDPAYEEHGQYCEPFNIMLVEVSDDEQRD